MLVHTPAAARRRAIGVTAALATVLALLAPSPSLAVPGDEDLEAAEQRLEELRREADLAVEAYDQAQVALADAREEVATFEARHHALEQELAAHAALAADYARRLYKRGPDREIAVLLASADIADAQAKVTTLRQLGSREQVAAAQLEGDRRELAALEERLVARREAAEAAAAVAEAERRRVERTLAEQRDEVERIEDEIAAAERARRQAAQQAAAAAEPAPAPPPVAANGAAGTAVNAALSQLGKPYRWGAAGPDAYDCSGLTMWAWARAGVSLPHSSRAQYAATRRVSRADLRPGDLVFMGSPIHHVSMYIGDGKVVDAPHSGARVRIDADQLQRSDIVGFGRP